MDNRWNNAHIRVVNGAENGEMTRHKTRPILFLAFTTVRGDRLTFDVARRAWIVSGVFNLVLCRRKRTDVAGCSRSLWRAWLLENCHTTSLSPTPPFSRRPKQPRHRFSCTLAPNTTTEMTHPSTCSPDPRTNISWSSTTTPQDSANPRPGAYPTTLP